MQETIKFSLSSNLGIIKKPDSNETYFTYSIPHKVMLLGMIGAIIGLNGYNYDNFMKYIKNEKDKLPDFYIKLKDLKLAVIPNFEDKGFTKKIQSFNNSVGYASQEQGNNLIVSEQILENPSWDIYILYNNSDEYAKTKDYLVNKKCEFIPYIGKNDYFANIHSVEVLNVENSNKNSKIDSIFEQNIILEEISNHKEVVAFDDNSDIEYKFSEVLPTQLDLKLGYTQYKKFVYTNKQIKIKDDIDLFDINGKVIYYF